MKILRANNGWVTVNLKPLVSRLALLGIVVTTAIVQRAIMHPSIKPGFDATVISFERPNGDLAELNFTGVSLDSKITMSFHKCPIIQVLDTLKYIGIHTCRPHEWSLNYINRLKAITLSVKDMPINQFLHLVFELEPEITYEYQKADVNEGMIWLRDADPKRPFPSTSI